MQVHPTTRNHPVVLTLMRHPFRSMRLIWRLFWDRRVSPAAKFLLLATVGYAVSPFDFLMDFLPVLGVADDLGLAALMVWWFLSLAPPAVRAEHEAELRMHREWPETKVVEIPIEAESR